MGMVLGKISVETPKYTVVKKEAEFEIREYAANLVAQVTYDPAEMQGGRDGGFTVLANYIGAFGKPNNTKPSAEENNKSEAIAMTAPVLLSTERASESIAMTAPVLLSTEKTPESIAMTAPVITEKVEGTVGTKKLLTMKFILPSKYTMESVPRPTDPRVTVKETPLTKYGVYTFSGICDEGTEEAMVKKLQGCLENAGYKVVGKHVLGRYNPPWTIPFLRTNEIKIPVE